MQENIMRDEVKIDNNSLMLAADNRSQKVKKRHQIGNCRFSSGKAILIGIKFSVMRNIITNNEFEQFKEIAENRPDRLWGPPNLL
jgi:hypothetical protein